MTEEKKIDAEGIAERLRLIYQSYGCENDLPSHDDVVKAINKDIDDDDSLGKMLQDTMNLYLSPISYEEALEVVKKMGRFNKSLICVNMYLVGVKVPIVSFAKKVIKDVLTPYSVRAEEYLRRQNLGIKQNFKYEKSDIEWELNDALGLHEENRVLEEEVLGKYKE